MKPHSILPLIPWSALEGPNGSYTSKAYILSVVSHTFYSMYRYLPRKPTAGLEPFLRYRTVASICDFTSSWLSHALQNVSPQMVLELGTGYSTFIAALYASSQLRLEKRSTLIVSVEHDFHWYEKQRDALQAADLLQHVVLLHCPLERRTVLGQKVVCYGDLEDKLASVCKAPPRPDFVFIDGPPGREVGGPGRRGAILQSIKLASHQATILIHDALRREEFELIGEFNKDPGLAFKCIGIAPVSDGLACCRTLN